MAKRALITGINGQDGSYLAELLLEKGYEVHGTIRRASLPNLARLHGIRERIHLHWGDLTDGVALAHVVQEVQPDEVYNLGAMSDVAVSFATPEYTAQVTGLGPLRLLEAVRLHAPGARVYQAGSSEMHGLNPDIPCNESSAFLPASPYAAAKVFAHHIAVNYRESYGLFICNGILYNHESPRRGVEFVTKKIALGVADALRGRSSRLRLGRLDTCRDWGHAQDYVRAMWLMLQQDEPDDFVIATGETHSVQEFVEMAYGLKGLDWRQYVESNVPDLVRPVDPPVLLGDSSKARRVLGWEPTVSFEDLVTEMVESACERLAV